jgi:hypothetical protein
MFFKGYDPHSVLHFIAKEQKVTSNTNGSLAGMIGQFTVRRWYTSPG